MGIVPPSLHDSLTWAFQPGRLQYAGLAEKSGGRAHLAYCAPPVVVFAQ